MNHSRAVRGFFLPLYRVTVFCLVLLRDLPFCERTTKILINTTFFSTLSSEVLTPIKNHNYRLLLIKASSKSITKIQPMDIQHSSDVANAGEPSAYAYTPPDAITYSAKAYEAWRDEKGFDVKKHSDFELSFARECQANVDTAFNVANGCGKADRLLSPVGKVAGVSHVTPLPLPTSEAHQLVISIDNSNTVRRDDCLQVFWAAERRLCVRVHIINATVAFPVGSVQDLAYRAIGAPLYFKTGPSPMHVPPVCSGWATSNIKELRRSAKELQAAMFFQPGQHRPALTATLYYDLRVVSPSSETESADGAPPRELLVLDEAACSLGHSNVCIHNAMHFGLSGGEGEGLEEGLAALSKLSLADSTYEKMAEALAAAGIKLRSVCDEKKVETTDAPSSPSSSPLSNNNGSPKPCVDTSGPTLEGLFAAHLASLASRALPPEPLLESAKRSTSSAPSSVVSNDADMVSASVATAGPNEYPPNVTINTQINFEAGMSVTFQPIVKLHAVSLIKEFTALATRRVLAHPTLRKFLLTYAYRKDFLERAAKTIQWASGDQLDAALVAAAAPQSIIDTHAALVGVAPRADACRLCPLPTTSVTAAFGMTHPGRDYSQLVAQRLLALCIALTADSASDDATKKEASSGEEANGGGGDDEGNSNGSPPRPIQTVNEAAVAAALLHKVNSFEAYSTAVGELWKTMERGQWLNDIANAIDTRLSLEADGRRSQQRDDATPMPMPVVVEAVNAATSVLTVSAPSLSAPPPSPKESLKNFSTPIAGIALRWPTHSGAAPPPSVGTTVVALVWWDPTAVGLKAYKARCFYEGGLPPSVLRNFGSLSAPTAAVATTTGANAAPVSSSVAPRPSAWGAPKEGGAAGARPENRPSSVFAKVMAQKAKAKSATAALSSKGNENPQGTNPPKRKK